MTMFSAKNFSILFICGILILCPLLWFLGCCREPDDERDEAVFEFERLQNIDARNQELIRQNDKEMEDVIKNRFPWLLKNNTLPNFFLHSVSGDRKMMRIYRDSAVVYMDSPWSGDSTILNCLQEVSTNYSFAKSPYMSSEQRLLWDSGNDNHAVYKFREKYKFHHGLHSFGICEVLKKNCSHMLMVQDPLQSLMTSYEFCKENFQDEHCKAFNANIMSFREWIIQMGSVFFNQLIFSPKFCQDVPKKNFSSVYGYLHDSKTFPCWFKQKFHLSEFTELESSHAVNHVIANLNKWFTVLGKWDELQTSLEMFQTALHFHFTKCNVPSSLSVDEFVSNSAATPHKQLSINYLFDDNSDYFENELYDENSVRSLKNDVHVKKALQADYRIYKEATRLYNIQKQVLMNMMR